MKEFTRVIDSYSYAGLEYGKKTKVSLVCLHGLTDDSHSFIQIANILEDHFHLILLDSPGHGHSSPYKTEEEYLFSTLVWQLDKVLTKLVDPPFYLLGHTWGGDIALHFAKHYPEKVKGVILLNGGYTLSQRLNGSTKEKALAYSNSYPAASIYKSWENVIKTYQHHTTATWNESMNVLIRSRFKLVNLKYRLKTSEFTIQAVTKAVLQEPCSTAYDYVHCPVLLLHSTLPLADPYRRKKIEHINKQLTDLKTIAIPNTKQHLHWDKPGHVAKTILSWKQTVENPIAP